MRLAAAATAAASPGDPLPALLAGERAD